MSNSRTGASGIHDEPGTIWLYKRARKYSKTKTKMKTKAYNDGSMSEGHGSHLKELPMAKCGTI